MSAVTARRFFVGAWFTAVFCCAAVHADPLPDWAKAPLKAPTPAGDYIGADDDWVIVFDEIIVGGAAAGGIRREYRQVFESIGKDESKLLIGIDYDAASENLQGPDIWVPGWSGHAELNLADKSIDVPNVDGAFVSAGRHLFASTKGIKPGRRVVVTWTVEDRDDFPAEQIILPVELHPVASFVVRAEPGSPIALLSVKPGAAPTTVTETGFTMTGVPAAPEIYPNGDRWRPMPIMALPFVFVVRADPADLSWKHVAERVGALLQSAVTNDTQRTYVQKALELTANTPDLQKKIAVLAAFAQSLVYRNIEWGIGSYLPDAPSEALRSMSGDCKAKALLLQAMLDSIGVRSVPVLARLAQPYFDYAAPPTVHAFNHVVLAIDAPANGAAGGRLNSGPGKGWVLFDPTDPLSSYGRAPAGLGGTYGLWAAPGGDLFAIKLDGDGDHVTADLTVDVVSAQSANFTLRVTGESAYANAATNSTAGTQLRDRIQHEAQDALRTYVPGLSLTSVQFTPPDHFTAAPPVVTMTGTITNPLQPLAPGVFSFAAPTRLLAHALALPSDGIHRDDPPPKTPAGQRWRVAACCSADASRVTGTVRLTLPAEWRVEQRPQMAPLASNWLDASVSVDGNTWTIDMTEKRGVFGAENVQRRLDDTNAVSRTLRGLFVVRHIVPG